MVKKKVANAKSSFNPVIFALTLLVVVIIAIFIKASILAKTERDGFSSLKENILSLQAQFESRDKGWKYDEYCIGYGTDVARNNSITCSIDIRNERVPNTSKISFNEYSILVEESGHFTKLGEPEVITSQVKPGSKHYILKTQYNHYSPATCELLTRTDNAAEELGLIFTCSFKASDYFFEQR